MQKENLIIRLTTQVDDDEPIYLTGSFNEWIVADNRFRMQRIGPGEYRFQFPHYFVLNFPMEYKFVRGGWDEEELDEAGNPTSNRRLEQFVTEKEEYVPLWAREGKFFDPELLPNIRIISEHFEIPQLIKTRRITALLPHDYYTNNKRYPVLYLQDGQNLFDDFAPYGNWGLTKRLAEMTNRGFGDIIVIAIDHANEDRIAEFTPNMHNVRFKGSEGKRYVRFLADTLKPHVDKHFRTIPDAEHTGIGGSSMGGLVSIYAGLLYPEVYSRLMIFSPSLWVMPDIYFGRINFHQEFHNRIYLYAGGKESKNMLPNVTKFEKIIKEKATENSKLEFKTSIDPNGVHSEYHWGIEFPKAIEWLFFETHDSNHSHQY